MITFTEFFAEYIEEFDNLFLEMPKYGADSERAVPYDDNDFAYLRAFKDTLETLAERNGLILNDRDYVDVFSQALRYRYGPKTLRDNGADVRDIPITLGYQKLNHVKAIKEIAPRENKFGSIIVHNVPVNPTELIDKLKSKNLDISRIKFADYISETNAYKLYKYMTGKQSEKPMYHPPADYFKDNLGKDDDKTYDDSAKKVRVKDSEWKVKTASPIPLDDDDKVYIADVRSQLEKLGEKNVESLVQQAMAQRYSGCFVKYENGKFVAKGPEYTREGPVYLHKRRGKKIPLLKVKINMPALLQKYQWALDKVGINFVQDPLYDCSGFGGVRHTGLHTVKRWLEKGFYKPGKGAIKGSESLSDSNKLSQIEKAQELYVHDPEAPTPNKTNGDTPRVAWSELVMQNVRTAFNSAIRYFNAVSQKLQTPGFREFIMQQKEEIIHSIFDYVYVQLSGMEQYEDQSWRITRAMNQVKMTLEQEWNRFRGNRQAPETGEEGSTLDMTRSREVSPVLAAGAVSTPDLEDKDRDAQIAAAVAWYYDPNNLSVDRIKRNGITLVRPEGAENYMTRMGLQTYLQGLVS